MGGGKVAGIVWNGDQLLWEIRRSSESPGETAGPTAAYGTVSYTHGGGIDRPLVITKDGQSILPHQNWRGQFSRGTYANGASSDCAPGQTSGCQRIAWPGWRTTAWHFEVKEPTISVWYGGLVDGMRDGSGQMYMRNRYYDPATGQFTQQDPIGIAGGLNTYGFAAGDPVSYSDPYGLSATCNPPTPECLARELWNALAARAESGRQRILSLGSHLPGIGDANDAGTALTGYDAMNAERVGPGGQVVAGVATVVPYVSSRALRNIVGDLYKGARTASPIGTGSTADAIRHETATGRQVGGRWHLQKGEQYMNALRNWLRGNPGADARDQMVARSLFEDLRSAVTEARGAGRTQ